MSCLAEEQLNTIIKWLTSQIRKRDYPYKNRPIQKKFKVFFENLVSLVSIPSENGS